LRAKRILAFTPDFTLLLAAGCTPADGGSSDNADIVVGVSLELSGAQSDVGKTYENALRLKVEQLNASRTDSQRKVTLRFGDNKSDSGTAIKQIGEYAGDPSVSAIITGQCIDCITSSVKTINEKGVPTISLAPSSKISSPVADRRYIFKQAPNASHNASTIVASLKGQGVKKIQFLVSADAYGIDAKAAMLYEADKVMEVGPGAELSPSQSDYTGIVQSVVDGKPDAVVVLAYPGAAVNAVSALRKASYKGKIVLDATAAGPLFLTGAAATAEEGAFLVFTQTLAIDDVIATTPAKAAQKQWFEDYTARYGSYQAQASFAADAVQLIVDAVDKSGSATDRDALRGALETTRTDGLTGPIRLTPSDHSGLMPQSLTMLIVRSGRWRLS